MGLFVNRFRFVFIGIVFLCPVYLNATKFDVFSKETSLLKDIQVIQSIIQDNKLKSNDLEGEIASLEYKVIAARKVIKLIKTQEEVSEGDLYLLQQQLEILKSERSIAINQYRSILIEEYKNRDYKTKLFFLASSKNLNEFVNRLNHLKTLKDFRKRQLKALENKQSEVADKLAVYSGNKSEKVKLSAKGLVVGRFGVQKHAKERRVRIENNGIDVLVSKYEKILASGDGVVKAVLQIPGSNTSVIIDHNGYYTVYSNIRGVKLKIGDKVKAGDYLALIGLDDEGLNKLHFELWKGTSKINPEEFFEGELN